MVRSSFVVARFVVKKPARALLGEIEEGEARSRKPPMIQTHPTGTPSSP
jgi:hypothetical protein